MAWDFVVFLRTARNLILMECLLLEFHLVLPDHGWPQVAETMECELVANGRGSLPHILQVFTNAWQLCSRRTLSPKPPVHQNSPLVHHSVLPSPGVSGNHRPFCCVSRRPSAGPLQRVAVLDWLLSPSTARLWFLQVLWAHSFYCWTTFHCMTVPQFDITAPISLK